jgi:hypothetical protein
MVAAGWEQTLREAWRELALHAPCARRFRTRRLSSGLPLDAHAGLRAIDDAPCLVIDAQAPPDALFEVGGMRLAHAAGDDRSLLVLSLEDPARADLFTTVCADAVQTAAGVQRTEALESFLARLDAWRRFLRERRTGLTQNETVGLMGELVVLRHLLLANPQLLSTWCSPNDGLHDFAGGGHAIEIKSTIGPAAGLRISNLDQLETSGLRRLDLLHVRMVEGPDGECLDDMIQSIAKLLLPEAARRSFENALLRRGLMPDDATARSTPRALIRSLKAFPVDVSFPRLVRNSVPSAVIEAEYLLELRALDHLSVEADAVLSAFAGQQQIE